MSLRDVDAKYSYGVSRLRFRALNDDLSVATASNVIGGAGPFDFSNLTGNDYIHPYLPLKGERRCSSGRDVRSYSGY